MTRVLSKVMLAALLVIGCVGSALAQGVKLDVEPATVLGGSSTNLLVSLRTAAPTGGTPVALTSSDPSAPVPASVTVAAGTRRISVPITTLPVAANTTVTLTGKTATASATTKLTVVALTLHLDVPADVFGGRTAQGEVSLNAPAPTGGTVVTLTSGNAAATVPASVTIPAGKHGVGFQITTTAVTTDTTVAIDATAGSLTATGQIIVKALSLQIQVPATARGGVTDEGEVALDAAAPVGGTVVTLVSNDASVTVPATVTIPAGRSRVGFRLTTTAVPTNTTVTITATADGLTATGQIIVEAASVHVVVPAAAPGGATVHGEVSIDVPAPSGGTVVTLTSSDPSTTVPATVTIPAGRRSVEFAIVTTSVTTDTTVTITATDGSLTGTAQIVVKALELYGVSIRGEDLVGGRSTTGEVFLTGVTSTSVTVTLVSNNAALTVPNSVVIPAGQSHVFFPITTTAVTTPTTVTVTATAGTISVQTTVAIED